MTEKLAQGVYPIGFDTPIHKKLVTEFKARLRLSRDAQRVDREKAWKKSEEDFMAYLPETEEDALRKGTRNAGKPQIGRAHV